MKQPLRSAVSAALFGGAAAQGRGGAAAQGRDWAAAWQPARLPKNEPSPS
jgi:hypothetical protein